MYFLQVQVKQEVTNLDDLRVAVVGVTVTEQDDKRSAEVAHPTSGRR
jgi:hypothetical protein